MLQTKALYNLLRLNAAEDPSVKADPWALEDLRSLPLEELFFRLQKGQIQLDKLSFLQFAESADTPEELADLLLPDEISDKKRDPYYLLLFELWRRLLPEKQSLSIFCDELDHQIALYDQGALESDESIQDTLANLLEILDENTDAGADPKEVFKGISNFCAHDIESFIYNYTSDLLDQDNSLYASELIDGFSPSVSEPVWFDFLQARLLSFTHIADANSALHRILENELELSLLFDILRHLSTHGDSETFLLAIDQTLPLLSSQEEFKEVLLLAVDYCHRLDREDQKQALQKMLQKPSKGPLPPSELKKLREILS